MSLPYSPTSSAEHLRQAAELMREHREPVFAQVHALLTSEDLGEAANVLDAWLQQETGLPSAWLLLGHLRETQGHGLSALQAYFQAVTRAQRAGHWRDQGSTPTSLLAPVVHAIERVRVSRRELFFGSYDDLRQRFGNVAVARVDRALSGYLKEWNAAPADPRQRPRFFYFPDLPSQPYLDPFLQPWAPALQAAFPAIRRDALRVLQEDAGLEDFIQLKQGERPEAYLTGAAAKPAWEAFFFYRHGERYDENHQRCPDTSAALESIELCRIENQAPEICFSVLRGHTHINAHYGVTNTRLVMHLPLVVPPDCALNVIDAGEHTWKEGELMMFDDTFKHEAWNRSEHTRIILLMDCWNPHLTEVEKQAVKQLIETISTLHLAHRPRKGRGDRS